MAKRKAAKKSVKKVARKTAKKVAKRSASKAARGVARQRPAARGRKPAARSSSPAPPQIRAGVITHTELASADPEATRNWCRQVLGWKFEAAMPTPAGPYHMWRFPIGTGGGIRANNPPEPPGSIPYCEVEDIQATYASALAAGAIEMLSPQQLPGGMGWIAIVAAPGAVAIGFWGMK